MPACWVIYQVKARVGEISESFSKFLLWARRWGFGVPNATACPELFPLFPLSKAGAKGWVLGPRCPLDINISSQNRSQVWPQISPVLQLACNSPSTSLLNFNGACTFLWSSEKDFGILHLFAGYLKDVIVSKHREQLRTDCKRHLSEPLLAFLGFRHPKNGTWPNL